MEFTIVWEGRSKNNSLCGGEKSIEASASDIAKTILLDELYKQGIKVKSFYFK